jgi:RNA polymerase sigma factor (sigma-70 family)
MLQPDSTAEPFAQLLDRCRGRPRDDEAWSGFFDLCDARVFALARRILLGLGRMGDLDADSADLSMELWVRLVRNEHERLREFEGDSEASFFSYVRRTLRNLAIDGVRQEQSLRRPTPAQLSEDRLARVLENFADRSADPLDDVEHAMLETRVRDELRRRWSERSHCDRDVAICLLAWFERLSAQRIAAIRGFGLSRGGVEKIVARGLESLRAAWVQPGAPPKRVRR